MVRLVIKLIFGVYAALIVLSCFVDNYKKIKTFILIKYNKIINDPIKFIIGVFAIYTLIIVILTLVLGLYNKNAVCISGVLTEFHGIIGDLFVFGFIILLYDKKREKKDKINSMIREIDLIRFWEDNKASFKHLNNLYNLKKIKYNGDINLSNCYFGNMELEDKDFSCVDLSSANFSNSTLTNCNFKNSILMGSNFENAHLKYCEMQDAEMFGVNIKNTTIEETNILNAKSINTYVLSDAKLIERNKI